MSQSLKIQPVVTKVKNPFGKRDATAVHRSNPIHIRYTRKNQIKINEAKEETETEKDNTVAEEL